MRKRAPISKFINKIAGEFYLFTLKCFKMYLMTLTHAKVRVSEVESTSWALSVLSAQFDATPNIYIKLPCIVTGVLDKFP